MNNSLRAVLLSGLVFPGVGQVVLKHYKRGITFILTASVSLMVTAVKAVENAIPILEKVKAEGGGISMNRITSAVTQATTPSQSLTFKLLLLLFIFTWFIGVVDAYIIGKRRGIKEGRTKGYGSKE